MKKIIIVILNLILVFILISCSSSKSIKNLGSEYYSLNIYKNNTEDLIFYLPIITNKEITSIIIEDVDDNQNDEIISYSLGDECQLEHKKNNYRVYSIPFTIKTSSEIKKINIKYIDFEIDGQKERFIPNAFNVTYFNTEKNYHISIRESIIINPVFPIIMSVNYYSSEDAIFNYLMNGLTNEKITKLDFDKSGMIESGDFIGKENSAFTYINEYSEILYTKYIYNHLISLQISEQEYFVVTPLVEIFDYSYGIIDRIIK